MNKHFIVIGYIAAISLLVIAVEIGWMMCPMSQCKMGASYSKFCPMKDKAMMPMHGMMPVEK